MKILVDVRSLGRGPSGIGMYLYNFITALSVYETIQFELLTDIAESAELRSLEEKKIRVHRYGKRVQKSGGVYPYFRFVQKKIYEVKPDIFWEGNNLIPIRIKNPYGKIIVTIHDVFPITVPECYGKIYPYYFKMNLGRTVRNVDAILYDSEDAKRSLEKYHPAAVTKPTHISYIVVDYLPEYEISNQGYFLYIGNLEERKGTDILLKAYCSYRMSGGEKALYLGGKIRSDAIKKLLAECQKKVEGIQYLGYVDARKKYELYTGCDTFVFPSRGEGFGMPVIEALNYGKNVIVSDLEIFKEIVGDVVTYFEYLGREEETEAVKGLANAMFIEMIPDKDKCREVVERYSAARLAGELEKFLKSLTEDV